MRTRGKDQYDAVPGHTRAELMPAAVGLRGVKEHADPGISYDIIFMPGDHSPTKSWRSGAEAALFTGLKYIPLGPGKEQDRIEEALLPRLSDRQGDILRTPETSSTETNMVVLKNILGLHTLPIRYRMDNGEPVERARVLVVTREGQARRLRKTYLRQDGKGMEEVDIHYHVLKEGLWARAQHLFNEIFWDERIARSNGGLMSMLNEAASSARTGSGGNV